MFQKHMDAWTKTAGNAPAAGAPHDAAAGQAGDRKAEGGTASSKPSATDKRPEGDTRSAKDIIDGDPTLKNLGNQSGVKDNLKKQVGDFENDPDAAYRASQVLQHIKGSKNSDGEERSSDVVNNGKIEGFTKDGDARHGTEAGRLQDFGKNGYSALPDDGALDKTKDEHVKKDGTNMDNAAFAGHKIAKGISEGARWINDQLDKLPGPLQALTAPLQMGSELAAGTAKVADAALTGGDVKQAGKDLGSGLTSAYADQLRNVSELAGDTLGRIPGPGKLLSGAIEMGATTAAGGLDVASTAIQGGDVEQAAEKMGYDTAQTAVESVVGLADPTGIAADAAGEAFRNGIDKNRSGSADGKDSGNVSGKQGKGKGGGSGVTGTGGGQGAANSAGGNGSAAPNAPKHNGGPGADGQTGGSRAIPVDAQGYTTDPGIPIKFRHITDGEINRRGQAVGYHHRPNDQDAPNASMQQPRIKEPNENGIYQAAVGVANPNNNNELVAKRANSTFFPDHFSQQDVFDGTQHAFNNRYPTALNGPGKSTQFQGPSGQGPASHASGTPGVFDIQGWYKDGKLETAFPLR